MKLFEKDVLEKDLKMFKKKGGTSSQCPIVYLSHMNVHIYYLQSIKRSQQQCLPMQTCTIQSFNYYVMPCNHFSQ